MLVSEMISQVKEQIYDIADEYSDDIIIKYINTGIKSASSTLIQINHNSVMKRLTVNEGDAVPSNFVKFAGQFPISAIAGQFNIFASGVTSLDTIYFAFQPSVKSATDTLPFTDETTLLYVEQYATILALNRNEFNVTADEQILESLRKDFISAMGTGA